MEHVFVSLRLAIDNVRIYCTLPRVTLGKVHVSLYVNISSTGHYLSQKS